MTADNASGANGLVWEDPPNTRPFGDRRYKPRTVWIERLSPLLERPGTWARVLECPNVHSAGGAAGQIRRASRGVRANIVIPAGRWEATARTVTENGTKHFYVYARYLGADNDHDATGAE
jgi:hypothetical protein